MKELGLTGVIARFKPLHIGGALMLEYACRKSDYVTIGLGSSNRYNIRNPFTVEETRDMVEAYLKPRFDNYHIVELADSAHISEFTDGKEWETRVKKTFGELDHMITGNEWVKELLQDKYNVIHPSSIIPKDEWFEVSATMVRVAMAKGEDYSRLLPKEVAEYISSNGLDKRFRNEFGLQTLAMLNDDNLYARDTKNEMMKVIDNLGEKYTVK